MKNHMKSAAAIAAIAIAAFLYGTSNSSSAQSIKGAILFVTPAAGASFDTSALPVGAFTVQGRFVGLHGGVGDFFRSGIKFPSGAVKVNDVYYSGFETDAFNGELYTETMLVPAATDAIDQENLGAVIGGTGVFKGAAGEMTILNRADGSFRAEWERGH